MSPEKPSSDRVVTFDRLTQQLAPLAGGKGRTLARLYQAHFRVPAGFIILPTAFIDDDLSLESWEQVQQHLAQLRHAHKSEFFAVRSSALSEDSAQASFAGEFETVLDVKTDAEVREAIRAVRCSRHHGRVQAYTQAQRLEQVDQEIAVVVQCLIQPDYAGVLFTVAPVTGDLTRMPGNFVQGLGEKLVSGQANAQAFTLSRPKGTYHGPAEIQRVARELYRNACGLEKALGGPQDIEWAVAKGHIYILQARPITTLNGYRVDTGEWNDSFTGNFLWSGTNLAEAAPHVLTPFTCSLRKGLVYEGVDLGESSSMGVDGYPLAGIIGGRGYINLSVQVSVIRPLVGGNSRKALKQVTAWWGDIPQDLEIPLIPMKTTQWWFTVLPRFIRLGRMMSRLRRQIPSFVAENPHWCTEMSARIHQMQNGIGLAALWRDEIKAYALHAFYLANAGATDRPNRLESELRGLVGTEDANALLSNLSGLSSPLESLGPVIGLAKVARGALSREAYREAYGHRGENETEYAWPRPWEDPTWPDRPLAEFATAPVDIEALLAKQQSAYEAAWQRFCERYPRKVKSMQQRLKKAAQAARQREAIRSEAVRSSSVVRAFALRAGELTGIGEDIFFLTMEEVLSLLTGDGTVRRFIPLRKEMYERYRALPPYPTLIKGRFDPFAWAADPNRRSDIFDAAAPTAPRSDSSETIKGFAGALGIVVGTVRRLDSLEESDQLQPGEILVTPLTNIGWTPLFPRLAAIVTDLGAPLSHAAIVARELGIPAVVGCGNATMRLKTGDRVRVNGGQGLVERLN